ncbi:hypothetical protein [Chitinimonas sp. BJB300]|uniref:hypothetical protein n=1 Tax=Chitinimonas sp. BJB300 TaxID=1559339 RepID=UPI001111D876|nr:hypothetical protein [Chitinimonas sp. BJB300]
MKQDDPSTMLTVDELTHLALEASERERYDLSITYLKQAMALASPPRSEILFLLGAQYAQIKMFDDACTWMQRAVDLNPLFDIAVFQLGLLQLMRGDVAAATTWQKLDVLPNGHALKLFRDGLLALNQTDLDDAAEKLRAGLACDYSNAPLLAEMRRVLGNVEQMQQAPQSSAGERQSVGEPMDDHIFLSAYKE